MRDETKHNPAAAPLTGANETARKPSAQELAIPCGLFVPEPDKPQIPGKKPRKITAEKYFDTGLYGTVSYFGQALTSVLLTQWIQHGGGKQKFAAASQWLGKNVLETHFHSTPENSSKLANTLLVATTLIMVGNCFLAPVKYMEDHKPEYVRKINDWLNQRREACGQPVTDAEKREQDAAIAHIAAQPKQTWGSLIGARIFSLAAIYTAITAVGGKRNKALEDASADFVSNTLHTAGVSKARAFSKPIQDFGRIAFVDFAYSIVGAGALYFYSHTLAPPKHANTATPAAPAKAHAPDETHDPAPIAAKENKPWARKETPLASFAERATAQPASGSELAI